MILVALRQRFGVAKAPYGEQCSSCITASFGALTNVRFLHGLGLETLFVSEKCFQSFLC